MSDQELVCDYCDEKAKFVLVDYRHEIIQPMQLFCRDHAFDDQREECPCCDDYWIDVEGTELLPTYQPGSLDSSGCCNEHP